MTLMKDAGVVVTGGGNGIGRAIAHRFAVDGARVVVNDLDAEAAREVAREIGGFAVPGDAASADGVTELIGTAREHLGAIDVYCANAGVASGGGPETADEEWQVAWEVNVMGHVRAARALLPTWLERGQGRFIATASAAGLLTMLGSAPYSVTKHAAVAHAEWLAATYGHRGVAVHCVCPQGVRTQMLNEAGTAGDAVLRATAIEPDDVAEALWRGIHDEQFLILPHSDVREYYQLRAADTDRWLGGMRKLQRRVEQAAADHAQSR